MNRKWLVIVVLVAGFGLPQEASAQLFKKGDELVVFKNNAPVQKRETVLGRLPKGKKVVAKETLETETGLWIKIDAPVVGWIHADYLGREGTISLIVRRNAAFIGNERDLTVLLDGQEQGTIKNGKTQRYECKAIVGGKYTIHTYLPESTAGVKAPKIPSKEIHFLAEPNSIVHATVDVGGFPWSELIMVAEVVTNTEEQSSSVEVGKITIDKELVEREASSETVEAIPGAITEFKKTRTITREAYFSVKTQSDIEFESRFSASVIVKKVELSAKVRASIESSSGARYSDSETREQTVRIDGDKIQKASIIWLDSYRTGTIEVTQNGKTHSVPFQFPIGTRLVIRKKE